MAHLTIEYSANLGDQADLPALVGALHTAALGTGVVTIDALRTQADARKHYAVGDREPTNTFVAVIIRIGPGRSAAEKHALLDAVLVALEGALGPAAAKSMLSVECQEIDAEFRVNRNNLRHAIEERTARD
jgi:5-carboxymethyl-2-hydroxymuconate isomerase